MKIAVINFYGTTPDVPGATKHYDMSRFFYQECGADVEFWMASVNHHTDKHINGMKWNCLSMLRKDKSSGIKLVYIKTIRERHSKVLRELSTLLFSVISAFKIRFSKEKYDAIVLSMPPVTHFCVLAAKKRGTAVIADVEDLWPLFLTISIHNKVLLGYYEHQANAVYRTADAIEAVSEGMLTYVKEIIDCKEKMTWVAPLGVNLHEYETEQISTEIILSGYSWKNSFKVMYIGAHGVANDLESVIETIIHINRIIDNTTDIPPIAFIFIGDGGDKKRLVEKYGNENVKNVFFEDPVGASEVPCLLRTADICLTNLKKIDCYKLVRPNKIFQYMAAAKPIICGIWGESQRIVEEAGAGIYVDFSSHEEAAKRIIEFINRSDLKEIGASGNRYIREHGDRDKIFKDFYARLEEIVIQEK